MITVKKLMNLLWIWGIMGFMAFILIIIVYTLFFARFQREYAPHIYDDHLLIYKAGSTQLFTREGYGVTTYGLNGQVVDKPVLPDHFTILIQGDSYVQAKQVNDAEKFSELVQEHWNAQYPDNRIQTINIGLEGQSMPSYIAFASILDSYYQPDLFILVISVKDFASMDELSQRQENILKRQITQNTSYLLKTADKLGVRAFFSQLQLQTRGFLQENIEVEEERPLTSYPQTTYASQLAQLKETWGERLVIVLNPSVKTSLELEIATERFLQAIAEHNIPLINLSESLQTAQNSETPPRGFSNSIIGQGHWNRYGHQLVADEIITFLETSGVSFAP